MARRAGIVTAQDVAGPCTGVLQGVSVATKDGLDHKEQRTIVDLDILHTLQIQPTGDFEVAISSDIIPRIRAIVMGVGPVAMGLNVVDIETSSAPDDQHLKSVEVHQIAFVKNEGEWILVLQLAKQGLLPEGGSSVNAYQFVSYPSRVAQQMSRDEAIRYVDLILDLVSQAQRLN
jgi:hypothetical protein